MYQLNMLGVQAALLILLHVSVVDSMVAPRGEHTSSDGGRAAVRMDRSDVSPLDIFPSSLIAYVPDEENFTPRRAMQVSCPFKIELFELLGKNSSN